MTVTVNYPDRATIQIEGDDSVGNSLSIGVHREGLWVEIDNPWSGSTETGFGQTASMAISKTDAAALGAWLTAWARKQ